MPAHFQLIQASRNFGATTALQQVDLEVQKGERIAFIGPSGSGKTTLLRLLGTQIEPTSGTVSTLGTDPQTARPRELRKLRSKIGFVPQSLGLVPNLRVLQNVLNGRIGQRSLWGVIRSLILPAKAEVETVYQLLTRVGISEKIYDRTDSLSGGQQQRVAVARTLFQSAEAVITDEPVSSIDPARARDTIELLNRLASEDGFTLIVSIHSIELARNHFSRVVGLKAGRIAFDKAPEDISNEELQTLFKL